MKKVYLTQKQLNLLRESIENDRFSDIDLHNPMNIPADILKKILSKGYNDAKSVFSDNIEDYSFDEIVNKLTKLISICQKKEEPIKEQLEKLCSDVVTSLFELDDKKLEFECNLVKEIPNTAEFHVKPNTEEVEFDSLEQKDGIDVEKIKHCFITALSIGASMDIADKLLKECLSKLFELDEELPHLYSRIIKINEYLLYLNKEEITEKNNMQGAYEEVTISKLDDSIKIKSEGIIFPFLLTESVRGFIEAIASKSLPEDAFETKQIIDSCDVLEQEPAYMIVGKPLWKKFIGDNEIEFNEYESLFDNLFSIDTEDFNKLMKEFINSTKLGKEKIQLLIDNAKYNKQYSDFEKDLKNKQKESSLIIDDEYLTEEELDNDFFFKR